MTGQTEHGHRRPSNKMLGINLNFHFFSMLITHSSPVLSNLLTNKMKRTKNTKKEEKLREILWRFGFAITFFDLVYSAFDFTSEWIATMLAFALNTIIFSSLNCPCAIGFDRNAKWKSWQFQNEWKIFGKPQKKPIEMEEEGKRK